MTVDELIAALLKEKARMKALHPDAVTVPDPQVVVITESLVTGIKKVEVDCFEENTPWDVVIVPDLSEL